MPIFALELDSMIIQVVHRNLPNGEEPLGIAIDIRKAAS